MKYINPDISYLGDAASVIQITGTKPFGQIDPQNPQFPIIAAYDLDE